MQKSKFSITKTHKLLTYVGCVLSSVAIFTQTTLGETGENIQPSPPPQPAPSTKEQTKAPLYFAMDIQKIIVDMKNTNPNITSAEIIKAIMNSVVVDQGIECVTKIEKTENINGANSIKTYYYRLSKQDHKDGLITNQADIGNISTFYVSASQAFKEAKTERPNVTSHQIVLASSPTSIQNYQFNISPLDQTGDYICYTRFSQPPITDPAKKVVMPPNPESDSIPHSRLIEIAVEKYIKANPPVIPDAASAGPNEKVPSRQEVMTQYQKTLLNSIPVSQSVVCVTKVSDSLFFAISNDKNFQNGFIKDPTGGKLEDDKTVSNIHYTDFPNYEAFFKKMGTGKIEEIKYGGRKDKEGTRDSKYYSLLPFPIDQDNVCFARVALDYKPND